jgi:hypothetical protein
MFSQFGKFLFSSSLLSFLQVFLLWRLIMRFTILKSIAIVDAFEEWQHLLEKVQHEIIVYPNLKNL